MIKITSNESKFYQVLVVVEWKIDLQKCLWIEQHFSSQCFAKYTWAIDFVTSFLISESFRVVHVLIAFSLQNRLTLIADKPHISENLSLKMLLISWWVFLFVRTKDFISSSKITLNKAIFCSIRKYLLKIQIHDTQK